MPYFKGSGRTGHLSPKVPGPAQMENLQKTLPAARSELKRKASDLLLGDIERESCKSLGKSRDCRLLLLFQSFVQRIRIEGFRDMHIHSVTPHWTMRNERCSSRDYVLSPASIWCTILNQVTDHGILGQLESIFLNIEGFYKFVCHIYNVLKVSLKGKRQRCQCVIYARLAAAYCSECKFGHP